MAHKRKEFSDRQKAQIFVRDRATCCFSGANLWLLDTPLLPEPESDWVDHVKPSAKGGGNEIENGVCASWTCNIKKRNNTADRDYLFEEGRPTQTYYRMFGQPSAELTNRLNRMEGLVDEDWYFNRVIKNIYIALEDHCARERYTRDYKRDWNYWIRSAFRFLKDFHRLSNSESLESRSLLPKSPSTLQKQWLRLREMDSIEEVSSLAKEVLEDYWENYQVWAGYFWDAENASQAKQAFEASESSKACPAIKAIVACDFQFSR